MLKPCLTLFEFMFFCKSKLNSHCLCDFIFKPCSFTKTSIDKMLLYKLSH